MTGNLAISIVVGVLCAAVIVSAIPENLLNVHLTGRARWIAGAILTLIVGTACYVMFTNGFQAGRSAAKLPERLQAPAKENDEFLHNLH